MPLKDHDAYWLFDGKADKTTPQPVPKKTETRETPKSFTVAKRVDNEHATPGVYVSSCVSCGDESPPLSQDKLRQWRHAHFRSHLGDQVDDIADSYQKEWSGTEEQHLIERYGA